MTGDLDREGPLGWLALGCATPLVLVLPAWAVLTGFVSQFDPALREAGWVGVGLGGLVAAGMVVAGALVVVLLVLAAWLAHRGYMRFRDARDRDRYARIAGDGMVLADDAWAGAAGPGMVVGPRVEEE